MKNLPEAVTGREPEITGATAIAEPGYLPSEIVTFADGTLTFEFEVNPIGNGEEFVVLIQVTGTDTAEGAPVYVHAIYNDRDEPHRWVHAIFAGLPETATVAVARAMLIEWRDEYLASIGEGNYESAATWLAGQVRKEHARRPQLLEAIEAWRTVMFDGTVPLPGSTSFEQKWFGISTYEAHRITMAYGLDGWSVGDVDWEDDYSVYATKTLPNGLKLTAFLAKGQPWPLPLDDTKEV
jgi:hypothetical protein